MNSEERLENVSHALGWLWVLVLSLLVNSCALDSCLHDLEHPAPAPKPAPAGGFRLPTHPHVPAVRAPGPDRLAWAP